MQKLPDWAQRNPQLRLPATIVALPFAVWAWFDPVAIVGVLACLGFLMLYLPGDRRTYLARKRRERSLR